jgi:lactoylglutathione lyase/glyoxylase I family protein
MSNNERNEEVDLFELSAGVSPVPASPRPEFSPILTETNVFSVEYEASVADRKVEVPRPNIPPFTPAPASASVPPSAPGAFDDEELFEAKAPAAPAPAPAPDLSSKFAGLADGDDDDIPDVFDDDDDLPDLPDDDDGEFPVKEGFFAKLAGMFKPKRVEFDDDDLPDLPDDDDDDLPDLPDDGDDDLPDLPDDDDDVFDLGSAPAGVPEEEEEESFDIAVAVSVPADVPKYEVEEESFAGIAVPADVPGEWEKSFDLAVAGSVPVDVPEGGGEEESFDVDIAVSASVPEEEEESFDVAVAVSAPVDVSEDEDESFDIGSAAAAVAAAAVAADPGPDPVFSKIAHVCLNVEDLGRSVDFYTKLGFKKRFLFNKNGKNFGIYLEFGSGSYIELFEDKSAGFSRGRLAHFCLETPDLDAVIESLKRRGVEYSPKKLGCDATYQIWLKDPDGNAFEVHQYTSDSSQIIGRDVEADW